MQLKEEISAQRQEMVIMLFYHIEREIQGRALENPEAHHFLVKYQHLGLFKLRSI